jgi:hypothetical protein
MSVLLQQPVAPNALLTGALGMLLVDGTVVYLRPALGVPRSPWSFPCRHKITSMNRSMNADKGELPERLEAQNQWRRAHCPGS